MSALFFAALAALKKRAGQILAWLTADACRMALVAAVLALGAQTVRIEGLHLGVKVGPISLHVVSLTGLRQRTATAESALAQVEKAQAQAGQAQAAANHEPAAISAEIARISDAASGDYHAAVEHAAALHAAPAPRASGHSCAPGAGAVSGAAHHDDGSLHPGPAQGSGGAAAVPGTDPASQGDDGQAGSALMVSVARSDWEKLNAEAALRAQLYQVGQEWIAQGIAVAGPADNGEGAR
ncbi:hypothetical protein [Novosphingobium pituita]|uniref:hypothetical protein n=1 Tax=Novosphingobium pituita TaxID=3056842 RepID=UPI00295E3D42|nr:hypothetical protein [Novosphingobium sp. IK01]